MPRVSFTSHLVRHVACPGEEVAGVDLRGVFEAYFALHPQVRHYICDEQGVLRRHVVVFIEGGQARDRQRLAVRTGLARER